MTVTLAPTSATGVHLWHTLMHLQECCTDSWTLVGGQMVHLLCAERGLTPARSTSDADVLLDVRRQPTILFDVTQRLVELGFSPDLPTPAGHQHRWRHGATHIDLLIPTGVGHRAAQRQGVTGSTTLETPGGTLALRRSERVRVAVDGRSGDIRRPDIVGAMVVKAAAHDVQGSRGAWRHRQDFASLASMLAGSDLLDLQVGSGERRRVQRVIAATKRDFGAVAAARGSARGMRDLRLMLAGRATSARPLV